MRFLRLCNNERIRFLGVHNTLANKLWEVYHFSDRISHLYGSLKFTDLIVFRDCSQIMSKWHFSRWGGSWHLKNDRIFYFGWNFGLTLSLECGKRNSKWKCPAKINFEWSQTASTHQWTHLLRVVTVARQEHLSVAQVAQLVDVRLLSRHQLGLSLQKHNRRKCLDGRRFFEKCLTLVLCFTPFPARPHPFTA